MTGTGWVLAMGAVWRATLLVTADEVTRPARNRLADRMDSDWFSYWVSCSWCASVQIGAVVVGSGLAWSDGWAWQLTAGALTASALTGFLASFASPDG